MKKTILLIALLVFAVALGTALADQKTDTQPYNGITYFGPAPALQNQAAAKEESRALAFNGITYFGAEQPKPAEKGSAAGGTGGKQEPEKKPYNGITAF
jgi:hypothetical protein